MKPVRDPCVCVHVCCEIRHLVLRSPCSLSTQLNRPLFTAPPTAIKHACLSVSVYVCNHLFLPCLFFLFLFPLCFLFSPQPKFKRFYHWGKQENSCLPLSLFLITSPHLPPPLHLLFQLLFKICEDDDSI